MNIPACGQVVQVYYYGEWAPFLVHEGETGWDSDEAEHIIYVRGWLWRPEHDGGKWLGWERRSSPSNGGIPHESAKREYVTEDPIYWRWPPRKGASRGCAAEGCAATHTEAPGMLPNGWTAFKVADTGQQGVLCPDHPLSDGGGIGFSSKGVSG